jgi:hypothetical protein
MAHLFTMLLLPSAAMAWNVPFRSAQKAPVRASSVRMDTAAEAGTGADVEALLRLCAITDRGQRATATDREDMANLVRKLEASAPYSDATDLNGEWKLVCTLGESAVYRSSPFFWAFREHCAASA